MGRTLKESSLRTLFQINVISITRGEKRLDIPQGEEHLYPYDKVTVVGTDRQLESFRTSMEQKKVERNGNGTSSQDEMEIGQFPVEGGSPLIGKTMNNGMYSVEDFGAVADYSEIAGGGVADRKSTRLNSSHPK